ncbi:SirB2 family protein [Acinetobacter radioresistens]|uniref:SirB2 family protein n=1 Tax=Acinetobacter radioresistens TaxID=40216 RepID=UPI000E713F11|nr:SirB2 family protein [Acinetobacter radioresistens]RJL75193.1 invasion protein expression up-regulator SirB [Acinetobacter radioresistens]
MDTHLFLKIIHMSSATLALIVFVLRGLTLFIGTQGNQPNPIGRKILVALQHLSFSLIILTGIILLVMNQFMVQPWFYAKIILFIVLFSSLMKAFRKDDSMLLVQRRAGLAMGLFAFIAIILLVTIKPNF